MQSRYLFLPIFVMKTFSLVDSDIQRGLWGSITHCKIRLTFMQTDHDFLLATADSKRYCNNMGKFLLTWQ